MNYKKIGLIPWLLIIVIWPFLPAWISLFARDWLMMPLLTIVSIYYVRPYFTTRVFAYSLLLFVILFLNALLRPNGDDSFILTVIRICGFISVTAFSFYFFTKANNNQIRLLCMATIYMLVFTTISTVILHFSFPGAVRNAVGGDLDKEEKLLALSLQRLGLSSYNIIHALPCLVPAFIMGFKAKWLSIKERLFYLIMAGFCIIHNYITGFTTPFLLSITAFVMSLFIPIGNRQSRGFLIAVYVILGLIITTPGVMSGITSFLSNLVGADFGQVQDRLGEINEYTQTGDTSVGDIGARMYQYNISLDTFKDNMLIGAGATLGGHSFILDTLAIYGLLGFAAYLLYFVSQFKIISKHLDYNSNTFYYLSIITTAIMLMSKNTGTWTTWCFLFIITPLMIHYIYLKKI